MNITGYRFHINMVTWVFFLSLQEEDYKEVSTQRMADFVTKHERKFGCFLCNHRYTSKQMLASHMKKIHGTTLEFRKRGVGPRECKICGKRLASRGSLYNHIKHLHEGKPWNYQWKIICSVLAIFIKEFSSFFFSELIFPVRYFYWLSQAMYVQNVYV